MKWSELDSKTKEDLAARRAAGVPIELLAAEVDMKSSTLGRRLREWNAEYRVKDGVITVPSSKFITWANGPVLKTECAIITGDLQLPYMDYSLAAKLLSVGKSMRDRHVYEPHLIIAGDMFNMDVFSKYPALHQNIPSFKTEMESGKMFLADAKKVFGNDNIHILMGNHERRLFFRLLGHFSAEDIKNLLNAKGTKFYDHSWIVLNSGGKQWRLTHQANYSIVNQTVGVKLAHKFKMNIMTHHQHRMSKGYDTSGEYVVVDNGCLANPVLLDYSNIVDSTSPAMNRGFAMIREGACTMFSSDDVFMDWELLELD